MHLRRGETYEDRGQNLDSELLVRCLLKRAYLEKNEYQNISQRYSSLGYGERNKTKKKRYIMRRVLCRILPPICRENGLIFQASRG